MPSPRARLVGLAGALVTAALLPPRPLAALALLGLALAALLWLRPAPAKLIPALTLGGWLLAPILLLTPWVSGESTSERLWTTGLLLARGLAVLVWVHAVRLTLSPQALASGLAAAPLPPGMALLIAQLLHQHAALAGETRQMMAALKVRRALHWRALFGLPQVWLPRLWARSERVGQAMALRGLLEVPREPRPPWTRSDRRTLGLTAAGVLLALAWRLFG